MSNDITPFQRAAIERVMLNPSVEDALANGLRTTVSRFLGVMADRKVDVQHDNCGTGHGE